MKKYEIRDRSVEFGGSSLPGVISGGAGVIYEPVAETKLRHIAFIYNGSPIGIGEALASRGFTCMEAKHRGMPITNHDQIYVEMSQAVEVMKAIPGVDTVIGIAWADAVADFTAYQALAENGMGVFRDGSRLMDVQDIVRITVHMNIPDRENYRLIPYDAVICLDPAWGAAQQLFCLDPAITNEKSGMSRDSRYDVFDPKNGFKEGGSDYSAEFAAEFAKAQEARMMKLIAYCEERVAAIEAGKGRFKDDEELILVGASTRRSGVLLFSQDTCYMARTKSAGKLLRADGSITTELIKSVRSAENFVCKSKSFRAGVNKTSVKNFLRTGAIRVRGLKYSEDGVEGIDWKSSYGSPAGNVCHISAPLLIMGMTGNWDFVLDEIMYNASASADKDLIYIEGAAQNGQPLPGYGDTFEAMADYLTDWVCKSL